MAVSRSERLLSVDAYRGFVMLAMASGGLGFVTVCEKSFPESTLWRALAYQFDHVKWGGCAFWDLIQPSFMFLVGVAMPFSYAARVERGDSWGWSAWHAFWRALLLVALGVFLYSSNHSQTHFTFENVLAQIGLGYFFVFLMLGWGTALQLLAAFVILGGTWWLFYQYPVVDPAEISTNPPIPDRWEFYTALGAHWNYNTNYAANFDRWFLNLFPRPNGEAFVWNGGGYHTLNFVPSMATTLFGVVTGSLLRSYRFSHGGKFAILFFWGIAFLLGGMALDHTLIPTKLPLYDVNESKKKEITVPTLDVGCDRPFSDKTWTVCPAVKKLWTPTWAIFSTGWALVMLALFYLLIECCGFRLWALPFEVIGMNSILVYLLAQWITGPNGWIMQNLRRHLGSVWERYFETVWLSGTYSPITTRVAPLVVVWILCYWLYRQRAFLRI